MSLEQLILQHHNAAVSDVAGVSARIGLGPAGHELFGVEIRAGSEVVLVVPVGELDLGTAGALEYALREAEDAGTGRVRVDLRRLSFMDCSGLRVLLRARSRMVQTNATLEVVCGPGQIRRLLQLTGMDRQLQIVAPPTMLTGIDGGRV